MLSVLVRILRPHPGIPAAIVTRPEPHVAHRGLRKDDCAGAGLPKIDVIKERIEEHRSVAVDEAPQ